MALTDANPAFGPTEQGEMLELSELDRFRHAQTDSETFKKIWIFVSESTGFCLGSDADLTQIRRGFQTI